MELNKWNSQTNLKHINPIYIKNHILHQKSHFTSKITFYIKTHILHQKSHFTSKITFYIKNHILHQKSHFTSKITFYIKNHILHQESHFTSKITFYIKNHIFTNKIEWISFQFYNSQLSPLHTSILTFLGGLGVGIHSLTTRGM